MLTQNTSEIFELEQQITKASEAYYLEEKELLSDKEFDNLVEKLRELDPENPLLFQVGFGIKVYGDKKKLPKPIRSSLPKLKTSKEILELFDGVSEIIGTPKVDGMHVVLEYDDKGNLLNGITRGDGVFGVDITPKISKLQNGVNLKKVNPKMLEIFPDKVIHGELYIDKSTFSNYLSEEYANPRNATAGIINSKSFDKLGYVSFICHKSDAEEYGFSACVPQFRVDLLKYQGNLASLCSEIYHKFENNLSLPLDGLVLNGIAAFKDQTDEIEAVVKCVNWELTPNGKVCPVVQLKEGYRLYGTKVENVSAFNYKYIKDNKIGPGAIVKVTKANELIPYITEVLSSGGECDPPEEICFEGKSYKLELDENGTYLVITHQEYLHQMYVTSFIKHYFTSEGVTDALAIKKALRLRSFSQIRFLVGDSSRVKDTLLRNSGWGESKSSSIADKFKDVVLDRKIFLKAIGIRNVGDVLSEKVSYHLTSILLEDADELISKINAPVHVAKELRSEWGIIRSVYELFEDLLSEEKVEVEVTDFVVLTGAMSKPRVAIVKELKEIGVSVANGISKRIKYLVCANPDGTSSKLKKARELGIDIITEDKMREVYGL